jgi:tetratricopeptide (TPR) repeat protein
MRSQAAIALSALAILIAPERAAAQQRGAARVPIFVAVSFRSPGESKLGVDVAEAVRVRMLRHFPMPPLRTLRIVTRTEINNTLAGSAFPPDTVLSRPDLRDLSRQLGADETMEGDVKRTAQGIEARARFYFGGNVSAPEVLPPVIGKNPEDVGRKIADLYVEARKELPAYERCKNALIQNQPDVAIAAAQEAMQQYAEGVLPRACLLTAYGPQYKKFPADSIIKLGTVIYGIDDQNEIAITQLADAYREKGDTANTIKFLKKVDSLASSDVGQTTSIARILDEYGAPNDALSILDRRLQENPGEVPLLERKWKILQGSRRWKAAIAAGEELVKLDSARADTSYFRRQIAAAFQDSQPRLALEYMSRATAKFPHDVLLLQGYMGELRRQGQLPQAIDVAKKVIAADPTTPNAYATVITLYSELSRDSAIAFAKHSLTGADSATRNQIGAGLLSLIKPAMVITQTDTISPPDVQKANWSEVLKLSAAVDSIVPTPNTAFYMSVAAFKIAQFGLANFTDVARTNRPLACTMLREASDNLLLVDLNMVRGGRVDPATASNLLQATAGMKPGIAQARQQLSCR